MSRKTRVFICHPYTAGRLSVEENMANGVAVWKRLRKAGHNPFLPTYNHWCLDEINGSESFYDNNLDEIDLSDSVRFVMNPDGLSAGQRRLYAYVQSIDKPYTIEEVSTTH